MRTNPTLRTVVVALACLALAAATVVAATRGPSFGLTAATTNRGVRPGGKTVYVLQIRRRHHFSGRVGLLVSGLPKGVSAVWSTAAGQPLARSKRARGALALAPVRARAIALTIRAATTATPGTYKPVVQGFARRLRAKLRLKLIVGAVTPATEGSGAFSIAGDLPGGLRPGVRVPLDLRLTNPYSFPIAVTGLSVTVAEQTSVPACSGSANYVATPYSGALPLILPPGTTAMSQIEPDPGQWPAVSMRNLAVQQDACRGARIQLDYAGTAQQ